MMSSLIKVSKNKFNEFIKNYPNKLSSDLNRICEPPIRFYFDDKIKTDAEKGTADYFFDKVVASVMFDWLGPNGEIDKEDHGKWWKYKIMRI